MDDHRRGLSASIGPGPITLGLTYTACSFVAVSHDVYSIARINQDIPPKKSCLLEKGKTGRNYFFFYIFGDFWRRADLLKLATLHPNHYGNDRKGEVWSHTSLGLFLSPFFYLDHYLRPCWTKKTVQKTIPLLFLSSRIWSLSSRKLRGEVETAGAKRPQDLLLLSPADYIYISDHFNHSFNPMVPVFIVKK